ILAGYSPPRPAAEKLDPLHSLFHTHVLRRNFTWRSTPIVAAGVANCNSPRQEFFQQLRYGRRNFSVARNDHCPFKIFPELARADAPLLQIDRRRLPDLYQRPVTRKRQCRFSIRRWTADNEMIA